MRFVTKLTNKGKKKPENKNSKQQTFEFAKTSSSKEDKGEE